MPARCDGQDCAYYNGSGSWKDRKVATVHCGYTHRPVRTDDCPKKQARIAEWWS